MKYSLIIFNLGFLGIYLYRISAIKKHLGSLLFAIPPADKKFKWLFSTVLLVGVVFSVYGLVKFFVFADTTEALLNNLLKSSMFFFIAMLIKQLGPLLVGEKGIFGGSWHVIPWKTISNYEVIEEDDSTFKFTLLVTDETEPIAYRVSKENTDKLIEVFEQKIEIKDHDPDIQEEKKS
jgi:hypothetical protein